MPPRLPRTIEVVDWKVAEILRKKSPAERLELTLAMHEQGRSMAEAAARATNPNSSPAEIQNAVIRRLLGESIANAVARG